MGCVSSTGTKEEKEDVHALRCLLLGTSSSGKSTMCRQMKILYTKGFTEEEQSNYKNILVQNVLLGIRELLVLCEDLNAKLDAKITKEIKYFHDANAYTTSLDDDVVRKARAVWSNSSVQKALSKADRKFEFSESLVYVMANLDRFRQPDWVPTHEDIVHVRQRTTGISETRFKVDKGTWTLIDVGGQKVERRKWIHSQASETLTAVLFVAALDEYDIRGEDEEKTGLQESLTVWADTVNSEYIAGKKPIVLFLNKVDLFQQKLRRSPLRKVPAFKSYKGGDDVEKGIQFIISLYAKQVKSQEVAKSIFPHAVCAIDTENVRRIFSSVRDFIFRARMQASGL